MKLLKYTSWTFLLLVFSSSLGISQNSYDTLKTVKMTAIANVQATSLTIEWEDDFDSNTYELYKKSIEDTSWGTPLLTVDDQAGSYVDTDIEAGELYEYQMVKNTRDTLGYAYLLSGVDYMPAQKRGNVLLLVDSTAAILVEDNLNRYMEVLICEGWIPKLVPVSVGKISMLSY